MNKLQLPMVTCVAVTGIGYKTLDHQRALDISCQSIEFGAVKLLQLESIKNIDSWNKAIIYELPLYIQTDYALLIHADGYIINPDLWNPIWLEYDYIGAPWPLPQDSYSYRDIKNKLIRVGNSVSLRSKKLLDLPNQKNLEWKSFHGFSNEDGFICVNYRHEYEKAGIKFAPLEVAKYFSKEHTIEENKDIEKTFMFHSL